MSIITSISSILPSSFSSATVAEERTLDQRISTLYLGAKELLAPVRGALEQADFSDKWQVELDPIYDGIEVTFGRDLRVVRADGSHLFPSEITTTNLDFIFLAYLPISCQSMIRSFYRCGFGQGFASELFEKKLQTATSLLIPHEQGKSVVEGGNCLMFKNRESETRALVGLASVTLTLISLEERGYFLENLDKLTEISGGIESVSDDFIRMAKNKKILDECLPIFNEMQKSKTTNIAKWRELNEELRIKYGGITGVKSSLVNPPRREEYINYLEEGQQLQAKWHLSQQIIAEDLQLPLEAIGFIPQIDFHIDLSIFAASSGKVFLHDESEVLSALEHCRRPRFVESYKRNAQDKLELNQVWKQSCSEAITRLGGEPIYVAGRLEGYQDASPVVNLMNSVVLEHEDKSVIITAESGIDQIDTSFSYTLKEHLSNSQVITLDRNLMSTLLKETSAGLHCITWEKSNQQTSN